MLTLPHRLPGAHTLLAGQTTSTTDVDTGGYDLLIGGIGFRFATDQQFPYVRATEPTTVHRFDSSQEVGEQTLAAVPWRKSQSSFHGGAGQLNLEASYTAFQYQQEEVAHVRYEASQGVDPWTPGVVTRLPDCHYQNFGFDAACIAAAAVSGVDYAIIGGTHSLYQVKWTSGPDSAPTVTAIDLSAFTAASNVTVYDLTTDGVNYYGMIGLTTPVSSGIYNYIIRGAINSASAPTAIYDVTGGTAPVAGVVQWAKERLMAGVGNKLYELNSAATAHSTLPATPNYSNPTGSFTFQAISESPSAVLAVGTAGARSSIIALELNSSGGTPTLSGGTNLWTAPTGEQITSMFAYAGTFLAIGTTLGVRVSTFDTSGALTVGPISLTTTSPVYALSGRDRFIYAGYTNQQPDGKTGLARIDTSMPIDSADRKAWAPDLRPPSTAPTGLGTVKAIDILPLSNRVVWATTEGIHTEGDGPGSDGAAWIRTSRIRYQTDEKKLYKTLRMTGSLDTGTVTVTALTQFGNTVNCGTFGDLVGSNDPGDIGLPDSDTYPWMQIQFQLNSATTELNTYVVKAIPAPTREHVITLTVACFREEQDRFGLKVTDPTLPRDRYQKVKDLEASGQQVRFVEFTNTGAVATLVVIDQVEYHSFVRPNLTDDFGGFITFKLRET